MLFEVVLFLFVCACRMAPTPDSEGNPVILQVSHTDIRLKTYLFYLEKKYPEVVDTLDHELHSYFFDQFKRELLIAKISQATGFRVTKDQEDDFIKSHISQISFHRLSEKEQGLWRQAIRRRLAIQQFLQREILNQTIISDEMVGNYYDANPELFQKEAVYHLRFMQTQEETQAKAFLKALKKSREPFVEVARAFTGNESYKLVVPLSREALLDSFQKALRRKKPGQHTKIIPVNQGEVTYYYVLYLESKIPAGQISFEDSYPYIRRVLAKEHYQKLLEAKIRRFAHRVPMKVKTENLPFNYIEAPQRKEVLQ